MNGGNAYSDKFFQLDADISVTTMAGAGSTGKNAKPFSGTFDGGGHTLTITHTATEAEGDIAPFRFIRNATICNLHVAGQITTAYKHAGGLAGRTYGTSLIRNCRVSTVIKSSVAGDATHGGIVAMKPDWSSAHLTIEGCVFDGKILTTGATASTNCAGFVGYTSYGSLTIRNSIYAPQADANAVNDGCTYYRYNESHTGTITLDKCYYTQTLGTAQGKQALSIGFPSDVDITVVPTGNATEYGASRITVYEGNPCIKYNGVVYAGSSDVVTFTFTHNYLGCTVTGFNLDKDSDATLEGDNTNGFTLTMRGTNVIFIFSMTGPALPGFNGNGTEEKPYEIYHADIWDYIAGAIIRNEGSYATAYYKLTDDITVTTMMGSESHRFKGHFDGNGYTLTVNYNTDEQYAAPFRYVKDAEIINLRVAGTIATSKKFAGGFVANAQGTNTMTNCRSSVTINSSVNGDGSHGGFVAHNQSGTFTMEGCVFDGNLLGSSTNNCGGFVGWNETNGSPEGVVKFTNCLFAPKSVTMGIERTYARSRTNDGAHVQMYYSSCRTNFGDNQQFRAYSISGGDGVTVATTQSAENTYTVSGITTYESGMMYDGVLYARENQSMSLNLGYTSTVPQGSTFSGFGTTAGTLSGDSNPFTLTMGKGNAVINAIINGGDTGWTHGGDGLSSNTAYIISTSADWNEFVVKVNNGIYGFNTAYYKLADNISSITITTMVGTEGRRFKGHFDGNGKTLTVSYGSAQSPFSEDYCAPFRYIEGADIHNLTVDGTIYTNMQFAAGITGNALNDNAITDCRSNVTIQSSKVGDGTHGGFVANCQNNTDGETTVTFTRCVFNGKLLGTNTDNCGGFVGWTEGNDWAGVKFVDCIFAPNELSVQSDGSATFSRGRYNNSDHITVENSYYTQHLGAMQGEMAYTSQPANATFVTMTIAGFTIYVKKALVTNVAATDITPTEATISWTGTDACSNYQVRYRVRQNPDTYSTSFDNGLPEGWTTFDNDNDEFGWTHEDGTKKGMAHSGYGSMYSASYINNYGALEPDNWLVSPQLTLGGTMKVWLKGQDGDEFREHFAIYLSTAGGSKSDFIDDASGNLKSGVVMLVPETETTNAYQEYTADLSAYNGQNQTGYIAIRHFNCNDQFYLVLDDFSLYDENAGGAWSSVPGDTPAGTTLTGLNDDTTYEYQVQYQFGGNTFYTPTATLSTLNADVAPTNLSATSITANTANISWKGFGDSYNLRYGKGGQTKVTLYVPSDIWQDDSGYQMLLDANHNTYGSVIPESGGLTNSGDASADTYANFEYKIPTNADGDLNTSYVVDGKNVTEVTITIPAGTYDWCITNPSPNDRVWIASENGNVGGRQNEFVFEAGKHYTFTVAFDDASENDCTNMTAVDDDALAPGDVTNVTGITSMSYALSDLTASTNYTVYVQSVKGDKTSEWSSVNFNTLNAGELYLYDDQDNSGIIAANNNQTLTVTLQSRTLYKDGDWNTLCLPFNVTLAGSPLAGGEARTLSSATLADGTLTLNFSEPVSSLTAGTPYIIKWGKPDGYDENPGNYDIVNPTFNSVSIISTEPTPVNFDGGSFVGQYSPFTINAGNIDKIIMLSTGNRLGYSKNPRTLRSFRCHFEVPTITGAPAMNSFVINFGEETSLREISNEELVIRNYDYYTLDGRKLQGKPTAKGVYIHNRHKVVVK